jgi:FkbM family methyltransferase
MIDSVDTNLMHAHSLTTRLKRIARRLINRNGITAMRVLEPDNFGQHTLLELTIHFAGRDWFATVRDDTTDLDLIDMLLTDPSMYQLPKAVKPKVIFDIGANIGIASLYFAAVYPDAQIHCFEPLPQNIELLRRNVQCNHGNITVHPVGLSDVPGTFTYHLSGDPKSFGGGTFHRIGANTDNELQLPVTTVERALADAGVDLVDLFKIDTEGNEWPIFKAIPPSIRSNAQAYIGELHGLNDWDFCKLLSDTHDLDLDKRYNRNCHPFLAVRKDLTSANNQSATLPLENAPRQAA